MQIEYIFCAVYLVKLYAVCVLVPPTFTSSPAALTAELTSSVTIQCSAAGDPDPAISWHRNGAQISSDDDEKYEGIRSPSFRVYVKVYLMSKILHHFL